MTQTEVCREVGITLNGLYGILAREGIRGVKRPMRPGKRAERVFYTEAQLAQVKKSFHPKEGFPRGVKRVSPGGKAVKQ